jgi:hypothetical protein
MVANPAECSEIEFFQKIALDLEHCYFAEGYNVYHWNALLGQVCRQKESCNWKLQTAHFEVWSQQ